MHFGNMTLPVRVTVLFNTTAGWAADVASTNPTIPEKLEIVGEDLGAGTAPRLKVGDGVNNWAGLSYVTGGAGTPQSLQDTLNIGRFASDAGTNVGDMKLISAGTGYEAHIDGNGFYLVDSSITSKVFSAMEFDAVSMAFKFVIKNKPNATLEVVTLSNASAGVGYGSFNNDTNSDSVQINGANGVTVNMGGTVSSLTTIGAKVTDGTNTSFCFPAYLESDDVVHGLMTRLGFVGSNPALWVRDITTSNSAIVQAGPLTAIRTVLLPDEGNGSGLGSTLVTHTTKDTITVNNSLGIINTNGAGIDTKVFNTNFQAEDTASNLSVLYPYQLDIVNNAGSIVKDINLSVSTTEPKLIMSKNNTLTSTSITHNIVPAAYPAAGVSQVFNNTLPARNGALSVSGSNVSPSFTAGVGAGAAPTISFGTNSDDNKGQITVVAGAGSIAGIIATITYASPYGALQFPSVVFFPANSNAAAKSAAISSNASTQTAFTLDVSAVGLVAGTTYIWNYQVQI